jgi:FtsZ-binding cell division protein ZapB
LSDGADMLPQGLGALGGAGVAAAMVRWLIGRQIGQLDETIKVLTTSVNNLKEAHHQAAIAHGEVRGDLERIAERHRIEMENLKRELAELREQVKALTARQDGMSVSWNEKWDRFAGVRRSSK